MSGSLFDASFTGLHQVLDLRQRQHTLTATNLANADTPGFRARYLDFQGSLAEAMDPSSLEAPEPDVVEVEPPAWSSSGNSVFPEQEHARLRANSMLYNGVTRGMSRRFALLKFAASDGRR